MKITKIYVYPTFGKVVFEDGSFDTIPKDQISTVAYKYGLLKRNPGRAIDWEEI